MYPFLLDKRWDSACVICWHARRHRKMRGKMRALKCKHGNHCCYWILQRFSHSRTPQTDDEKRHTNDGHWQGTLINGLQSIGSTASRFPPPYTCVCVCCSPWRNRIARIRVFRVRHLLCAFPLYMMYPVMRRLSRERHNESIIWCQYVSVKIIFSWFILAPITRAMRSCAQNKHFSCCTLCVDLGARSCTRKTVVLGHAEHYISRGILCIMCGIENKFSPLNPKHTHTYYIQTQKYCCIDVRLWWQIGARWWGWRGNGF